MSHINFASISHRNVTAIHNLPANTKVRVVNQTSGVALSSPITTIAANSNGQLAIQIPPSAKAGDYFLKAQDGSGNFIAQSVVFHVA
jgi:hypothetical protein